MTTIACAIEDQREFNALRAQHNIATKKTHRQPEFFKLLLERWKQMENQLLEAKP